MLRRLFFVIPGLAVLAAYAGMGWDGQPAALLAGVALVALGVTLWLTAIEDRRIDRVAQQVRALASGETRIQVEPVGGAAWQRLVRALNAVGSSLQERFDDLAGERARVERILDDLPLAVLLFAPEGLAYANPAARRLFSADQAVGRSPRQVLDVTGLADAVVEAREMGHAVSVEVERGGRLLAARASVTDADEVALVVTDQTEARRVEMIRRDFVTNASHELKTPVAGIQALAESLELAVTRDPSRARQMISRLRAETERLAQLVRELLDLARLEEAVNQPRQALDLAETVRQEVARLQPLAQRRQVQLEAEALEPAGLVAVPEDMRLIVANLLENGLQYNRPGGHVRAAVRRRGAAVELTVTDDGIGIAAADLDRIFERFYRVDKARSRAAGGTGLGLSLARHAVQRHGGTVTVDSVLGEGSTFTVRLPVEGTGDD